MTHTHTHCPSQVSARDNVAEVKGQDGPTPSPFHSSRVKPWPHPLIMTRDEHSQTVSGHNVLLLAEGGRCRAVQYCGAQSCAAAVVVLVVNLQRNNASGRVCRSSTGSVLEQDGGFKANLTLFFFLRRLFHITVTARLIGAEPDLGHLGQDVLPAAPGLSTQPAARASLRLSAVAV